MLAALLASAIVLPFVCIGLIAAKALVIDGPAFEAKSDKFDLRINNGNHVRLISSKPAPIVWEEPEAYFPVNTERRVVTGSHTFIVEQMGS
jgi:hypothetical protein